MATIVKELKAKDVMVREPVCVEPDMNIRQLARLFDENEISGAPVVDTMGRVIGIVSKTDLIRRCSEGLRDQAPGYLFEAIFEQSGEDEEVIPEPLVVVGDFMEDEPVTVSPEEPVWKIAAAMADDRIHRVIVVDRDRVPVGIITSLDVLRHYPAP